MKRFNIYVILLTLGIALFMYPETYKVTRLALENIIMTIKLSNYYSDEAGAEQIDKDRIQVVFMFDDGWESVYSAAYPVLKAYGYKASVGIIPSVTGEKEYLSYKQIGELYMEGWDILNHTYSHKEEPDCDRLLNELNRARDWMKNRFLTSCEKMVVIPYGRLNPYLIKLLIDSGYENVRNADNTIVLDPYSPHYYPLKQVSLLPDVEVGEVKACLFNAWYDKQTIVFILHKVGNLQDINKMTYAPNRFSAIIQYLSENEDKYQVVPFSALFDS